MRWYGNDSEEIERIIKKVEQSLGTLTEALGEPLTDIVRDAIIQRFEYVFELSWKTIQTAAQYMGTPINSPRESVKTAFKFSWVKNADLWLEAMEARNKTSHTYNIKLANEVYEVAKRFPPLVQELLISLKAIST